LFTITTFSQKSDTIKLPEPQKTIGKPLMEALNNRQSSRTFSPAALPLQELSNILWAGFGINRQESGKRTAPSAMNWQEITIYALTAEGIYTYDAKSNSLTQIVAGDFRKLAGVQPYVKEAPLNLIYVADYSKVKNITESDKYMYAGADAAFIAENVYLYCASQNLAVVVRASIDKKALGAELKLKPGQMIVIGQTIGYPKN